MEGISEKEKERLRAEINDEKVYANEERQEEKISINENPISQPAELKKEANKQESSKVVHKADPLQDNIIERPVADEALRQMNRVAPADDDGFQLIGSKEEVMAQMETDVSLGTSLLVGKVTKESLKEARQKFRDKYNNKVYERRDALAEEIKAYTAQNRIFDEQDRLLGSKISALRDENRLMKGLSEQKQAELQKLELEAADVKKYKEKNSAIIKRKKETIGLLKQDLKIRFIVANYREKLEKEKAKGNSTLMNNMIEKVEAFDNLINSPKFDIAKQYSYIKEFVDMRNAIALYHNKNKGYKWFEKGENRRDLASNFLKNLTIWIGDLPEEIQDTFIQEMENPEYDQVRSLATSDELYQTLGEKEFKKKAVEDGEPERKVAEYVTPLTIRMMSAHRSRLREAAFAQEYDLTKVELESVLAGDENKDRSITYHDPRSWIYTFEGLKRNFDGTPVDPEKERFISEGVNAWRHNDLEKMKPFLDRMIDKIMSYDLKLEDFLSENLKKRGPALMMQQDLMLSVQNVFFKEGTIGAAYLKEKGPALRAKLELISTLNPFVRVLHIMCSDMNVSDGATDLGKVKAIRKWVKQNKGKRMDDLIRKLIENPESIQNMDIVSLVGEGIEYDRVPEPDTTKAFRKKYHLGRDAVDETKEFVIPYENLALAQLGTILTKLIQQGEYFDDINSEFRKYKVAQELRDLITVSSEEEDQILDVYHQIEAKENEVAACKNAEKKAELKEELIKLHQHKDDYIEYIKQSREKKSEIIENLPKQETRFLANYFGYQDRNPVLANKYNAKRTNGDEKLPTGVLSGNTGMLMNLIKKAEYEESIQEEGITEERKDALQNYINIEDAVIKAKEEHIYIQKQLELESGTANSIMANIHYDEQNKNVPKEARTNMLNSLIGKEYADRIQKITADLIKKHRTIANLEKQAREILWKQVNQFSGIKDKDGNLVEGEKANQILNIANEYMCEQGYLATLISERVKVKNSLDYFKANAEALKIKKCLEDFDQAINQQYKHIVDVKGRLTTLCKDVFPQLENAGVEEVAGTLKNSIYIMTEQGEKTLKEMEKDEFINEKMFAERAAGLPSMRMNKEGAELAYRRTHHFHAIDGDRVRHYVAPGSEIDNALRSKYSTGDMDRIVAGGLKYVRLDDNNKVLPEDEEKDKWNRKWIKACLSDDYENDIRPLLQDMMDELLEIGKISYADRIDIDYNVSDDVQFQKLLRTNKLALVFADNILKHPSFSKFKDEYINGNDEKKLKWKEFNIYYDIGPGLNTILMFKMGRKYSLNQNLSNPSDATAEEDKIQNLYSDIKQAVYAGEVFKYAKNKLFSADPAEVFMRMAELPEFNIEHMDEYADFFKFYAAIDDIDAELAGLDSTNKDCEKRISECNEEKTKLLRGKQDMLERMKKIR